MDHNMVLSYDYAKQKRRRRRTNATPSQAISGSTINGTLRGEGRATNNQHQRQQERATRGNRVSGCGNITINQKISFDGGISESEGNAAATKMTVRAARAGATRRRQRGVDCSKGAIAVSSVQKVVLSFNGYWGKRSEYSLAKP